MTNYNSIPQPEQTNNIPEHVQFNDGEVALKFATAGDVLELGYGSGFKYACTVHMEGGDIAVVKTKSGNQYAIGNGAILNKKENGGWELPIELPPIEIGKQWEIPGIGTTSDVEEVWFRYKSSPSGAEDSQVDRPSPFPRIAQQLQSISEQLAK